MNRICAAILMLLTGGCTHHGGNRLVPNNKVTAIALYDCRVHSGLAGESLIREITVDEDARRMVDYFNHLRDGWTPLRVTTPAGLLRIDLLRDGSILQQYRVTPDSIVTYVNGKAHLRDCTSSEKREILRIAGLDDSFLLQD